MPRQISLAQESVKETLLDIVNGDQTGFSLRFGYYAELQHGLMGFFPAIFKDTNSIIFTTDLDVMTEVVETLPPRRFRIIKQLLLVCEKIQVGYALFSNVDKLQESLPIALLDRDEFARLIEQDEHPFEWAPGLISSDMSPEEFKRTLELAARKHA